MRRDEVLEHGQAFTEVRLDRAGDDLALRVGHEATHCRDLAHLRHVSSRTRVDHHVDRVGAREVLLHRLGQLGGRVGPDGDELLAALLLRDRAALVELVDLLGATVVAFEDVGLLRRGLDVLDRDGDAGAGAPVETEILEPVEGLDSDVRRVALGEVVDDLADALLADVLVDVREVRRQHLVEERAAEGGLHDDGAVGADLVSQRIRNDDVVHAQLDACANVEIACVVGHDRLRDRGERAAFTDGAFTLHGQPVGADDHLVRRDGHGATVSRLEDVVRRQHQDTGLGLSLGGQRQVDCHLVTVEVGVERGTDERVQLDGLALDELRLERLDAEAVQRWCTVQQHGVFGDDLVEDVPHDRTLTLDHALGGLDVLRVMQIIETLHDERLEQLERHGLRQTTLVQLQLRADDDDRAAGVVHALAEEVLTEAALLALEHVRDGLQGTVAGASDGATATAVVEQ